MVDQHARLAPSSAYRWGPGGCPGSVDMEARYPEPDDSEDARAGTAAHWYLTEHLYGRVHPVGAIAPNGVPIDQEMIDCANDLLADILATRLATADRAAGLAEHLYIEFRVSMGLFVHPDNWGTPDVVLIDWTGKRLHVWDYKYGHRYVDAFENWQCLDYAIGAAETYNIEDIKDWTVTITIAQPRNYAPEGPMRYWTCSGADLRNYARSLHSAALAASEQNAPLITGEHCRDCSAAVHCPANQRARGNAVDLSYRKVPGDMDLAAMSLERLQNLAAIARLNARQDAIDATILGALAAGKTVPYWGREPTQGRTRWTMPAEDIATMGDAMGVELRKPMECITPTQAKKLIDEAVISAYSMTPSGAMKLVPLDDKKLRRAFGVPSAAENS